MGVLGNREEEPGKAKRTRKREEGAFHTKASAS